jgi:DNA modification methylase
MNDQQQAKSLRCWQIRFIDPKQITYNPFFHRENLEKPLDETFIESAVSDLKQPIIIRPTRGSRYRYQTAFGHRRWQAFLTRGVAVPCVLRSLSDEQMVDYAWDDTFQYEAHSPREEAKLIVTRLDWKLRRCPEYKTYGRDPIKVLRAMETQSRMNRKVARQEDLVRERSRTKSGGGRPPTGKYPVPEVLCNTVEKVFAELPERHRIDWSTFVREYLILLDIPADVQEALDAKGVSGSAGVMAAIARVKDPFARKQVLKWAKKRRRIPVRIIDKRVHVLNKCAHELGQLSPKPALKQQLIELILEKCPHPTDVQLEAKRLLASVSKTSRAKEERELSAGVYIADSQDMREIHDGSVKLIVTSPPYLNKMEFDDYLSRCRTADEFFARVERNIIECVRVMAPAGKLVMNWGEPIGETEGEKYEEEILAHRWVNICRKAGLRLWGKWIWWKDPPAYAIAQDRVQWKDAARGDGRIHLNWEWLLVFRKPREASNEQDAKEVALSHEDFVALSNGVWRIPAAHEGPRGLAVFPEELVERVIRYYSQPGDTVLDPFLGTGTTVLVARRLGRNGVGYEISKSLASTIQQRLGIVPVEKSSAIR